MSQHYEYGGPGRLNLVEDDLDRPPGACMYLGELRGAVPCGCEAGSADVYRCVHPSHAVLAACTLAVPLPLLPCCLGCFYREHSEGTTEHTENNT